MHICVRMRMSVFVFLQSNGLEPRESLAQDLGILEPKAPVDGPLLLEVVRRCQQKKGFSNSGDVRLLTS